MIHNIALQNKVCIQYYQPAASLGQQIFANLKYQVIEENKFRINFHLHVIHFQILSEHCGHIIIIC